MAQITYTNKVALNVNSDIPAINKVQDTDMNQIKSVVNDNETKVLLAVTDTAPANCDTGDMYYNTTTKLIYTATATDTWGSTGVTPTENTLYIEFSTQSTYAYNGTDLISVGGGTDFSNLIVVGTDTPTEETKLQIETMDLSFQGLEISNTYTTGDNVAYSCNYINNMLKKETVTATTDSNGFITTTLSLNNSIVVGGIIKTTNKDGFVLPFCALGSGVWTLKTAQWDLSAYASTSLTIDVYYYEI